MKKPVKKETSVQWAVQTWYPKEGWSHNADDECETLADARRMKRELNEWFGDLRQSSSRASGGRPTAVRRASTAQMW